MRGNAMSYIEQLDNRKAHHDAEAAKDHTAREKRDVACVKRAEELVVHLQQEDSSSIGLEIEWENSQVRLRGEKFDIIIDVDVDDYSAFVSVPSKKWWGTVDTMLGPQHIRSTLAELDILILDAIETVQVPKS
jgi:hypothetical protein